MVSVIVNKKGFGKTKQLIDMAEKAVSITNGNVVFIEKGSKLTYDLTHKARLIDVDQYNISGYNSFFGFLSGICAGNYDVTDIFIDSTFKICGDDKRELSEFLNNINAISLNSGTNFIFSLSCDKSELPADIDNNIKIY